jgi:hypothetical protein
VSAAAAREIYQVSVRGEGGDARVDEQGTARLRNGGSRSPEPGGFRRR